MWPSPGALPVLQLSQGPAPCNGPLCWQPPTSLSATGAGQRVQSAWHGQMHMLAIHSSLLLLVGSPRATTAICRHSCCCDRLALLRSWPVSALVVHLCAQRSQLLRWQPRSSPGVAAAAALIAAAAAPAGTPAASPGVSAAITAVTAPAAAASLAVAPLPVAITPISPVVPAV